MGKNKINDIRYKYFVLCICNRILAFKLGNPVNLQCINNLMT